MQKICLWIAVCAVFSSCKFNPNYQGKGEVFLQGEWEENVPAYSNSLVQYTRHNFRFTCDSVYVTLETKATANYYPDSCYNGGIWKEYAKGNYVVRNDTLFILSTFTKSNYKQKLSGCYRIGQYLPTFLIKTKTSNEVKLQGLQQHLPLSLKLKRRTVCIPKPL